jgi:prolyl oligopeptidase
MGNRILTATFLFTSLLVQAQTQDPYIWLEEVDGERAMQFVNERNAATFEELMKLPEYNDIYNKSLAILNSTDRIVFPAVYGTYIYNFWQDQEHVRGIWRRTDKNSYLNGNPNWETVLDIDALAEAEGVKWVFKGAEGLYPDNQRFLISLSDGGGDAIEIREFDAMTKTFIQDGFYLPEAKGSASYVDKNMLIISSDFGPGTMTTSGYPNQVKLWKRGTPLSEATLIMEGQTSDVGTWGSVFRDGDKTHIVISRAPSFFESETYVYVERKAFKLDLPNDCSVMNLLNNQLLVQLKSDWTVDGIQYAQGALISLDFDALLNGKKVIQQVLLPDASSSISAVTKTKNKILVALLRNVQSELYVYSFEGGKWSAIDVEAPAFGDISIAATDESSDDYYFSFSNFITPTTLYAANADNNTFKPFQSLPGYFDASKLEVKQYTARSKDGTLVPYFLVAAKNTDLNGSNPTLLNAYGGFEVSKLPFYSGIIGSAWLEKGGVFVLANIRGGGEFGPQWHQAGLKEKRQHVYDDFHAVAEDLIAKKITSPQHLGIMGGSNGGLLMGVAFTQRPDLYEAVLCQVPLLDMQRYNKLLAGASWMGEYGNPDIPEEWAYISKYSPYQNLKKDMDYPEVFFTTSTRDDRVHPGHARKMVAKMTDMGYKVYYYENIEGGHAGSSTNEQRAKKAALEYSYLWMKLK